MAGAASAHQAATATHRDTSQEKAGRRRRSSAHRQGTHQGATAAAAAAPATQDSLSRLQQLADASPRVAQLRRLQALADHHYAPLSQLAGDPEEKELVRGQFATAELPPQRQQAPRTNNTGLPDQLKSGIESLSGLSMDHVRVHYNSSQPAQLNAFAYAQGSDIHLAPGQEQHLPHEAWHVVQQAQGRVRPTMQMKEGVQVNDDQGLEKEADVMGVRAVQMMMKGQNAKSALENRHAQGSVVQRSSKGLDAGDEDAARLALDRGAKLIQQVMMGCEQQNIGQVGFSNAATTHAGPVATERKDILVELDQNTGLGLEQFYITPSQRIGLHRAAEQNGWNFRYSFNEVEYVGQHANQYVAMGNSERPIQFAAIVTGSLNIHAAKGAVANTNLANGNITYLGVTVHNVTTGVNATDLHRQPMGTGVGNTRPNNWATFLAMAGGVNPFKQGHHLSQELGGDGTNDNLAPFTGSLNALHCKRVEDYVIDHTDNPPRFDQYADYSVIPTYAGNTGIVAWALSRFNNMTVKAKLAAMVNAGLIQAATAAGILGAPPPQHALTPAQVLLAHNWITTYVNSTFPTYITCTVTFIDFLPAPGIFRATAPQVVKITNDF